MWDVPVGWVGICSSLWVGGLRDFPRALGHMDAGGPPQPPEPLLRKYPLPISTPDVPHSITGYVPWLPWCLAGASTT